MSTYQIWFAARQSTNCLSASIRHLINTNSKTDIYNVYRTDIYNVYRTDIYNVYRTVNNHCCEGVGKGKVTSKYYYKFTCQAKSSEQDYYHYSSIKQLSCGI